VCIAVVGITTTYLKESNMFLLKEIDKLYQAFSDAAYEPNILDGKTKELIAVSASVMADCVPCINHHYRRAVELGASQEEIAEALAIAMSISAGSKRAKYAPVIATLENSGEKEPA
jgi:AhpD family alkylhydroperoxidase